MFLLILKRLFVYINDVWNFFVPLLFSFLFFGYERKPHIWIFLVASLVETVWPYKNNIMQGSALQKLS